MRSKKNMIKRLVSLLLCSAICVVAAAAADNWQYSKWTATVTGVSNIKYHGRTAITASKGLVRSTATILSTILLRIGSTAAVLSVMIRERCCGICWSRTQTSKILSNSMRRTKNTNRTQRSLRSSVKNTKWSQVTRSILKMNCSIGWTIGSRAS